MATPGLDFIEAMERAVGSGNIEEAVKYLREDVSYTVGAQTSRRGIDAVVAYAREQEQRARWDGHTVQNVTRADNLLVVEVLSHFTRVVDGARVTFPCADLYRFVEGRIQDWRVYAGMCPIQAT